MHYTKCPICKADADERGNCACDPPFDLKNIPMERLYGVAYDILQKAKAYYAVPENMARFKEWEKGYDQRKAAKRESALAVSPN